MIPRWRPALLGGAIVWGSVPLSQLAIGTKGGLGAFVDALTNPVAIILAIALAALSAWLMGRLRTSR
jgi:hypothetical protein